mmetsp:Transcript_55703/g.158158  ORF Transcript_55703/g.158158 Transcript_55703/m.158158 type:complete len:259 (+) Transcript_55703:1-777(+)
MKITKDLLLKAWQRGGGKLLAALSWNKKGEVKFGLAGRHAYAVTSVIWDMGEPDIIMVRNPHQDDRSDQCNECKNMEGFLPGEFGIRMEEFAGLWRDMEIGEIRPGYHARTQSLSSTDGVNAVELFVVANPNPSVFSVSVEWPTKRMIGRDCQDQLRDYPQPLILAVLTPNGRLLKFLEDHDNKDWEVLGRVTLPDLSCVDDKACLFTAYVSVHRDVPAVLSVYAKDGTVQFWEPTSLTFEEYSEHVEKKYPSQDDEY